MPEEANALQIMADPEVSGLANTIMMAVAAAHGVAPGQQVQVDIGTVMEALMMVHASILDMHPEVISEDDVEEAANDAGAMLRQMIRVCRQYHADNGTHVFQLLGMGAKDDMVMKRRATVQ